MAWFEARIFERNDADDDFAFSVELRQSFAAATHEISEGFFALVTTHLRIHGLTGSAKTTVVCSLVCHPLSVLLLILCSLPDRSTMRLSIVAASR